MTTRGFVNPKSGGVVALCAALAACGAEVPLDGSAQAELPDDPTIAAFERESPLDAAERSGDVTFESPFGARFTIDAAQAGFLRRADACSRVNSRGIWDVTNNALSFAGNFNAGLAIAGGLGTLLKSAVCSGPNNTLRISLLELLAIVDAQIDQAFVDDYTSDFVALMSLATTVSGECLTSPLASACRLLDAADPQPAADARLADRADFEFNRDELIQQVAQLSPEHRKEWHRRAASLRNAAALLVGKARGAAATNPHFHRALGLFAQIATIEMALFDLMTIYEPSLQTPADFAGMMGEIQATRAALEGTLKTAIRKNPEQHFELMHTLGEPDLPQNDMALAYLTFRTKLSFEVTNPLSGEAIRGPYHLDENILRNQRSNQCLGVNHRTRALQTGPCHRWAPRPGDLAWQMLPGTGQLMSVQRAGLCLEAVDGSGGGDVQLRRCDASNPYQRWAIHPGEEQHYVNLGPSRTLPNFVCLAEHEGSISLDYCDWDDPPSVAFGSWNQWPHDVDLLVMLER